MDEQFTQEIFQTIDDIEDMRYDQQEIVKNHPVRDSYGYAFESADSFSMDELTFTETGLKLWTEADETFWLMRQYNRHSPLFIEIAQHLEKLIGQLGSFLITREVMEQRGLHIIVPDDLTVSRLRQMTAFAFRKAFKSYLESLGIFSFRGKTLQLSMRYAALDKRLYATGEKIRLIREGKLTVDVTAASPKPKMQKPSAESDETPKALPSDTAALPVNKAAVRDMEKQVPGSFLSDEAAPVRETAADLPSVSDAETEAAVHPEEPGSDEAAFAETRYIGDPQNYPDTPEELSPGSDERPEPIDAFFEDYREFSPLPWEYSSA